MPKTRIMVFGTFDRLHKGHLSFFRQARSLSKSPYLIVSVARDINVKKIKGKFPKNSERKRLDTIKKSKLVDKVVLGQKSGYLTHIKKQRPEIIALGYDQKAYTKDLNKLGIKIVRLKPFKHHIYKSSLINLSQHRTFVVSSRT